MYADRLFNTALQWMDILPIFMPPPCGGTKSGGKNLISVQPQALINANKAPQEQGANVLLSEKTAKKNPKVWNNQKKFLSLQRQ